MPKVIGYTPPWLSKPSLGARIFSDPAPESPTSPLKRSSYLGRNADTKSGVEAPRRLVAARGSEVFVVVGNKIRWTDLARVQDEWETSGDEQDEEKQVYRVLNVPVFYQIRQLVISPSGNFLAICTETTVHIAVLPDSSHLKIEDDAPLKLKTYQLGPTIHVIPESPIASVLWHPLAASTNISDCLVTVTAESALRLWEIDTSNQWTFERPALAIDLRKLADAVSCDQDVEPSGFGKNRGFSADEVDMEASAACFGGQGSFLEDPWASMTMWIAMRNGDIYALTPLLPSIWRPSSTTIPALSTSAVSRMASIAEEEVEPDERRAADQQYEWVAELDSSDSDSFAALAPEGCSIRPQNPSAMPRLQGPFELPPGVLTDDIELSDIYVVGARLDDEEIYSGEDEYTRLDSSESQGLPYILLCLTTTQSQVIVALEMSGVSGQWLPKQGRSTFSIPGSEPRDIVSLDKILLAQDKESAASWPMLTPDFSEPYSFYATIGSKITFVSLADWAHRVGKELSSDNVSGLQTRLVALCRTATFFQEDMNDRTSQTTEPVSAPVIAVGDSVGVMLMSCNASQVVAVSLDESYSQGLPTDAEAFATSQISNQLIKAIENDDDENTPELAPTRAPYTPPTVLYQPVKHPFDVMSIAAATRQRKILAENPIRLSPACLDIMTAAHRTFSSQTGVLEKAAAEVFRRCERLRDELADQVEQMTKLAERLQHLNSLNNPENEDEGSHDARMKKAVQRQSILLQRFETLRKKASRVSSGKKELSMKEISWIEEVEGLQDEVGADDNGPLQNRFETVKRLANDLLNDAKRLEEGRNLSESKSDLETSQRSLLTRSDSSASRRSDRGATGPTLSRLQKEKIADVMNLVERETAVIDAVMERLDRLGIGVNS